MPAQILKDRLELLDTIDLKGKACLEVGVFKGDFAVEIHTRKPSTLFLIDPWKAQDPLQYHDINNHPQEDFEAIYQSVVDRFKAFDNVVCLRNDSYEAFKNFCGTDFRVDFVYIDGNHGYPYVLADLIMWSSRVRKGGWICGHDYKSSFVGVQMAVDHFCAMTGNEVTYETADAPWKSFGIQIK